MCLPWKHKWGDLCVGKFGYHHYALKMCSKCFVVRKKKIASFIEQIDMEFLLEMRDLDLDSVKKD